MGLTRGVRSTCWREGKWAACWVAKSTRLREREEERGKRAMVGLTWLLGCAEREWLG